MLLTMLLALGRELLLARHLFLCCCPCCLRGLGGIALRGSVLSVSPLEERVDERQGCSVWCLIVAACASVGCVRGCPVVLVSGLV